MRFARHNNRKLYRRLDGVHDPARDPWPGDVLNHVGGGSLYVVGRTLRMVRCTRDDPLTVWREPKWMRLSTFSKVAR